MPNIIFTRGFSPPYKSRPYKLEFSGWLSGYGKLVVLFGSGMYIEGVCNSSEIRGGMISDAHDVTGGGATPRALAPD